MLLGLRSTIYPAPDLEASKAFFTTLLGVEPYFDTPQYVGYSVAGDELGLLPSADPAAGPATYWGVRDLDAALEQLTAAGAELVEPVADVGEGIRMAAVAEPGGNHLGLIENPVYASAGPPATAERPGPGR